jgi:hypothetical protein
VRSTPAGGTVVQAEKNTPVKTAAIISEMNFSAARSRQDIVARASSAPMDLRPPHPRPDWKACCEIYSNDRSTLLGMNFCSMTERALTRNCKLNKKAYPSHSVVLLTDSSDGERSTSTTFTDPLETFAALLAQDAHVKTGAA